MIMHPQPSAACIADAIAVAQTFSDLERVRRELRAVTGLHVRELEVLEWVLAEREHELIEFYRGRF
jgi:hypothetical protein